MENKESMVLFHLREGEIALRKWFEEPRKLTSGACSTFGALIWHGELTCFTLLLLKGSETMLFELEAWGSMYIVFVYGNHS